MSFVDAILAGNGAKNPEFYEILGCGRNSTTEQIQAEYRARVRNVHPDKQKTNDGNHDEFAKLQEAYTTLTTCSKRKIYDSWLDSPIPGTYEEFSRNSDMIQMSTHWAVPKHQQMIKLEDLGTEKSANSVKINKDKWDDGRRYQSDVASKFRNYQV